MARKAPQPWIYTRHDKPSKYDWLNLGGWHLSRMSKLEYLRLHQNEWQPMHFEIGYNEPSFYEFAERMNQEIYRSFGIPKSLLEPRGYNCPCVLEPLTAKPKPVPTEKERIIAMRLSLILVKGGLSTWERFFELYPLALDYHDIRFAYQNYIVKQILSSPQRLWAWLRSKIK